jgi:hypothetical protein
MKHIELDQIVWHVIWICSIKSKFTSLNMGLLIIQGVELKTKPIFAASLMATFPHIIYNLLHARVDIRNNLLQPSETLDICAVHTCHTGHTMQP